MKYIVLATDKAEFMFVFSTEIMHKNMADVVRHVREDDRRGWDKPLATANVVSAGFIMQESRKCFGTSESLGVMSRGEIDTKLLADGGWRALEGGKS